MIIKYLGHASFLIKTKQARLVTDPFDTKSVGLKYPKQEADIVTTSHAHPDHNAVGAVGGSPLVIDRAGEYEKQGMHIKGVQYYHDKNKGKDRGENILFKIESEGLSVLHLGDLGATLDDATLDQVGDVDVLLIPTGGFYTIDPAEAVAVARKIEPSIVIPMHYQVPGLNPTVFKSLVGVEDFIKKMGAEAAAPVHELTIKKEDLDASTKVVVMTPA